MNLKNFLQSLQNSDRQSLLRTIGDIALYNSPADREAEINKLKEIHE